MKILEIYINAGQTSPEEERKKKMNTVKKIEPLKLF